MYNNNNKKFTLLINVLLNSKMQNRILDTVLQEVGLCKQDIRHRIAGSRSMQTKKHWTLDKKSLKIIFNRDYFEKV